MRLWGVVLLAEMLCAGAVATESAEANNQAAAQACQGKKPGAACIANQRKPGTPGICYGPNNQCMDPESRSYIDAVIAACRGKRETDACAFTSAFTGPSAQNGACKKANATGAARGYVYCSMTAASARSSAGSSARPATAAGADDAWKLVTFERSGYPRLSDEGCRALEADAKAKNVTPVSTYPLMDKRAAKDFEHSQKLHGRLELEPQNDAVSLVNLIHFRVNQGGAAKSAGNKALCLAEVSAAGAVAAMMPPFHHSLAQYKRFIPGNVYLTRWDGGPMSAEDLFAKAAALGEQAKKLYADCGGEMPQWFSPTDVEDVLTVAPRSDGLLPSTLPEEIPVPRDQFATECRDLTARVVDIAHYRLELAHKAQGSDKKACAAGARAAAAVIVGYRKYRKDPIYPYGPPRLATRWDGALWDREGIQTRVEVAHVEGPSRSPPELKPSVEQVLGRRSVRKFRNLDRFVRRSTTGQFGDQLPPHAARAGGRHDHRALESPGRANQAGAAALQAPGAGAHADPFSAPPPT